MSESQQLDDFFGELVVPQEASDQFKTIIEQKNRKTSQKFMNKQRKLQQFLHKNNSPNKFQYQNQNPCFYEGNCDKEHSVGTTKITTKNSATSHQKLRQKTIQIRNLKPENIFACKHCKNQESVNCQFCEGTKKIGVNSNMLKFFQYITDYKLGIKNSYEPNAQTKANKSQIRESSSIKTGECTPKFYSTIRTTNFDVKQSYIKQGCGSFLSFEQFKNQVKQQKIVHENHQCDICQVLPIVGNRYHCDSVQCNNDFDLCEECYQRYGHHHYMKQFGLKSKIQRIKAYQNLVSKTVQSSNLFNNKCKKDVSNSINHKKKTYLDPQNPDISKIYVSSIH